MRKVIIISSMISALFCGDISGVSYFNYATGDADNDENHGFYLDRVYLTYENDISEKASFTFKTDAKNSDDGGGWKVYVKNAKLDYVCKQDMLLTLGLQNMNMFNVQEKTWGNRFLAKTSMEENSWSPSADLGVGLSATFGDISGSFLYTNGEGYWDSSSDNNERISLQAMYGEGDLGSNEGFNVGGVFSMLNYTTGCDCGDGCACGGCGGACAGGTCEAGCGCGCEGVGACDCTTGSCACGGCGGTCTADGCASGCGCGCGVDGTGQVMGVFGGFSGFGARVGFEYNMGTDLNLDGYAASSSLMSFYGTYDLSFVEGLSVMLKYDMLDKGVEDDSATGDDDESVDDNVTTMLVGLSYQCTEGLTVSPNMTQTTLGDADPTTAINVTFKLNF